MNVGQSAFVGLLAMSSPAFAVPFALTDTATGDPNPPIIVVSSPDEFLQNGDFRLTPIQVTPFPNDPTVRNLGDATEEWSNWAHDFNGTIDYQVISAVPPALIEITSATMTLNVRTGGDTPDDDLLGMEPNLPSAPLGLDQFTLYTLNFDLLDVYGEAAILNALLNDGKIEFGCGNDTLVYGSTININGNVIPEPAGLGIALGFGALTVRGRRRAIR